MHSSWPQTPKGNCDPDVALSTDPLLALMSDVQQQRRLGWALQITDRLEKKTMVSGAVTARDLLPTIAAVAVGLGFLTETPPLRNCLKNQSKKKPCDGAS